MPVIQRLRNPGPLRGDWKKIAYLYTIKRWKEVGRSEIDASHQSTKICVLKVCELAVENNGQEENQIGKCQGLKAQEQWCPTDVDLSSWPSVG